MVPSTTDTIADNPPPPSPQPLPPPPNPPSLNLSWPQSAKGAGEAASQHFWQGSRLFGRGARWLLAECGFWGREDLSKLHQSRQRRMTFGANWRYDLLSRLFSSLVLIKFAFFTTRVWTFARNDIVFKSINGPTIGVGDVCFFLTMRCFNDAMFSNS